MLTIGVAIEGGTQRRHQEDATVCPLDHVVVMGDRFGLGLVLGGVSVKSRLVEFIKSLQG